MYCYLAGIHIYGLEVTCIITRCDLTVLNSVVIILASHACNTCDKQAIQLSVFLLKCQVHDVLSCKTGSCSQHQQLPVSQSHLARNITTEVNT